MPREYPTLRGLDAPFFATTQGAWAEDTGGDRLNGLVVDNLLLAPTKVGGGPIGVQFAQRVTPVGPVVDFDVMLARYITRPLAAQLIDGTLDLVLAGNAHATTGAGNTVRWKLHVWLARYTPANDTWTNVATLLANHLNPTAFADDGGERFRGLDAPVALTPATALDGDRLVVEVGNRVNIPATVPAFGSNSMTLRTRRGTYSAITPLPNGTIAVDGTAGAFFVSTQAGWLDFSAALTEQAAPSVPVNDACADAEVIASLPFASGPLYLSESTDVGGSVWFQWTADEDCRVQVSALGGPVGSNDVDVEVTRGTCGAPIFVTDAFGEQWIRMSQSLSKPFTATAGETYRFRVYSGSFSSTATRPGTAYLQVWKHAAPVAGDVFINAQLIVALREGQLVQGTPEWFGDTPTGSAIDYTGRTMDAWTGNPHTGERLFIVLFGFELVEVLDLADLTAANSELVFIAPGDDPAGTFLGQHLASIVFDRAGNITLGFFGDNYDHIGQLATPATMYPITLNPLVNSETSPEQAEILATHPVQQEVQGSEYVDIASDQRTLFYTSAGRTIFRWDVVDQVQLAPFATLAPEASPGPRPGIRGLRLLPPGDGSGGLLVTDGINVKRLNAAGVVTQVYTPADTARAQDLDKVELTPDATQFWVTDQLSTVLYKFDLATGVELAAYPLNLPAGQLCGFSVYQGYRAGVQEPPVVEPPEPEPPGPGPFPGGHGCPDTFPIDPGGGSGGCPVAFFP